MFIAIKLYWLISAIPLGSAQLFPGNLSGIINLPDIGSLIPGIKANIDDYPFLVHLSIDVKMTDQVEFLDIFKFLMCVGSLISPTWVVTSASCLNTNFLFPTLEPQIVSNDHVHCRIKIKKGTPMEIATEAALAAAEVLVHPEYTIKNLKAIHNFGLIRMKAAFDLYPKASVATMPDNSVNYKDNVTIVGYNNFMWIQTLMANKTEDLGKLDTGLQRLSSKVWNKKTCEEKTENPSAICIGESGHSPWILDMGGPLIHNDKVVGIALGSDSPTEYGAYEDVYAHRDWINSKIHTDNSTNATEGVDSGAQRHKNIFVTYLYFHLINQIYTLL